jgi:4-amino-4-deoxy-L-arabinose transferase-like glycosyltransferase
VIIQHCYEPLLSSSPQPQPQSPRALRPTTERWAAWFLFGTAIVVLFLRLGSAALFEPDEGRNAEKAREILVLNDWITPHENFHPVLDKPIFFYWLIALAYKVFGISEWAARLPSALAALACIGVVHWFVRRRWDFWTAQWSGLILLTSLGFFLLARVVIFDMNVTLFLALALCAFYEGAHADDSTKRRIFCLLLYASLAIATLIKGLIGIVLPGMVIFFYLLITKQWFLLRRIYLIPGVILFLVIVIPWYLKVDAIHPGFLRYYFWDEHVGRFTSSEFNRSQPWYYFIWVGMISFFPWTLLVPVLAGRYGKDAFDDKTIFLSLWFVLPFLFFSASDAKLPHYILPVLPALSILTAVALTDRYQTNRSRTNFALLLVALTQGLTTLYVILGSVWPAILAPAIRASVAQSAHFLWVYGVVITAYLFFLIAQSRQRLLHMGKLYWLHGVSVLLFLFFTTNMVVLAAPERSASPLAKLLGSRLTPATQVIFFDTYQAGMAFYLRMGKPIWVVTHADKKRTFLGNYYVMTGRAEPTPPRGKALLDFEEFQSWWETATQPLLIIVKTKNLPHLQERVGKSLKQIGAIGEYLVMTKP